VKKLSKITGFLLFLMVLLAPFSMLIMPSLLIAEGDAMTTASNILDNLSLFQLAIVINTLIFLIEIVVVVLLYRLFESVNKTLSLIAAAARFSMTVIQGINVLFYLIVLEVLTNPDYVSVFGAEQTAMLSSLFLQGQAIGVYVWGIFFGFHLIILGILVFKSGFFPKILGMLLMAASLGYLAESYSYILLPGNSAASTVVTLLLIISAVGELAFTIWLLKGVNIPTHQVVEGGVL
jgi:hypothetical protein